MYKDAIKLIEEYDNIIIHRHSYPDGDALGSQIGLTLIIKHNYPHKRVRMVGDSTKRYDFMGFCADEVDDSAYSGALAIILDTSSSALISDNRYSLAAATLRIDHHIFCEKIAQIEVVDTTVESCCGLVTDMAIKSGLTIPDDASKALFTGMVTDSGRFRYDSTTSKTFALASRLCEQQFDINQIYTNLYADDFDSILTRASFVLKIKFSPNNVAYIYNTQDEVENSKMDTFAISRGMVGTMSDIKGVSIWVNFTENNGKILCEIRSSKYNINPVACKYGGGGHAKASGATLSNKEEAFALLADLDKMCEEVK